MITSYEPSENLLEQLTLRPGLDSPKQFGSLGLPDSAVWNELKALQKTNERLRQQAASLQSRNEELEAYAHTIAHALKNPLAVLILISSAIAEIKDLTRQEIQEYMQQINSTAFEMRNSIDDLIMLSEVEKTDRLAEPLEMNMIVADALKRLQGMTRDYKGHIITPKTWPVAIGYAPWIEEVWVNYISNALKYGGRSPRIELGASIQPDGMVRFWTRDNGPGISKGNQRRLFSPFTRLGKVQRPGSGLGLSIVHRIIDKSGGQAGVESEAGQGSLFFFTLPTSPARRGSVAENKPCANLASGRLMTGYPRSFQRSQQLSAFGKE
jgi:two-component system sensor histidine kinase/response regulator